MTGKSAHLDAALLGKLGVIGGLILAQGLPGTFINTLMPALFRDLGLPLDMFYVFTLAGLPIWLKWLWAPLVDRTGSARFGYRKSWLVPTTLLGALVYASLALVEPSLDAVWIIVAILATKTLVMGFQDVAVDGYTVENLYPGERGYGAAANQIAVVLGTVGAGAGLMALYDVLGWEAAMLIAAASLLLFSLPAFIRPEPPPSPEKRARLERASGESILHTTLAAFRHFLVRKESVLVVGSLLMLGIYEGYFTALLGAMFVDMGLSFSEIGIAVGLGVAGGGLLGSVLASWLLNRFGVKPTLQIGGTGLMAAFGMLAALSRVETLTFGLALAAVAIIVLISMPISVTFSACRFRWASTEQAGTDYTIQSALYIGSRGLGIAIAGFVGGAIGYTGYYVTCIPLTVLVVALFIHASSAISNRIDMRMQGPQLSAAG